MRNRNRTGNARNITVKPAMYGGIQMRSKTEAQAAQWFELMGWKWLYEPEGFLSEGSVYIPDFYLPEIETLVEVKPIIFVHEMTDEKRRIIEKVGRQFVILSPMGVGEFAPVDMYGWLEGCDPNGPERDKASPHPMGWHFDDDVREISVDNNGGRYPRNYFYMGAGCKLRWMCGRECPCTN